MLIAQHLEKNDLTQRAFAREIGCTTAFVNGLVNGKNTDIKISLLAKIAKATKLPAQKLMDDLLSYKRQAKK